MSVSKCDTIRLSVSERDTIRLSVSESDTPMLLSKMLFDSQKVTKIRELRIKKLFNSHDMTKWISKKPQSRIMMM